MRSILLSLITIVFVGAMLTGATRAVFSAQNTITGNDVSSGQVSMDTQHVFHKPLSVTNLFPGNHTDWAWVDIKNTSSAPIDLDVYLSNAQHDAALWNVLKIKMVYSDQTTEDACDNHSHPVYDGLVNNMYLFANAKSIKDDVHTNDIVRLCQRVYLDSGVDNTAANKTVSFDEVIVGTQNISDLNNGNQGENGNGNGWHWGH